MSSGSWGHTKGWSMAVSCSSYLCSLVLPCASGEEHSLADRIPSFCETTMWWHLCWRVRLSTLGSCWSSHGLAQEFCTASGLWRPWWTGRMGPLPPIPATAAAGWDGQTSCHGSTRPLSTTCCWRRVGGWSGFCYPLQSSEIGGSSRRSSASCWWCRAVAQANLCWWLWVW